mgnify:CR=1 FL=1
MHEPLSFRLPVVRRVVTKGGSAMRKALAALAVTCALFLTASGTRAADDLAPGSMLDKTTADKAKDLLPPEILDNQNAMGGSTAAVSEPFGRC